MNRRHRFLLFTGILVLISLSNCTPGNIQDFKEIHLQLGETRTGEAERDGTVSFKLSLMQDHVATIEIMGDPDHFELTDPHDRPLGISARITSYKGRNTLYLLADPPGVYRLHPKSQPSPGNSDYRLTLTSNRKCTPHDRAFAQALYLLDLAEHTYRQAKTLQAYLQAKTQFEEALHCWALLENRYQQAMALNGLGRAGRRAHLYEQAVAHFNEALLHLEYVGDYPYEEMRILKYRGMAYFNMETASEQALQSYEEALFIAKALGERRYEAILHNEIGAILYGLGDAEGSVVAYRKALKIQRALGLKRHAANSLLNLSQSFILVNRLEEARKFLHQSLDISRFLKDPNGEAKVLLELGRTHFHANEFEKALRYYAQAELAIPEQGGRISAILWDRRGPALHGLGRWEEAIRDFGKALAVWERLNAPKDRTQTSVNLAETLVLIGREEEALAYTREALSWFQAANDPHGEAHTRYIMAKAERQRGRLSASKAHLKAALEIVESFRAISSIRTMRTSFSASRYEYYEYYFDLLMEMHRKDKGAGYDILALETWEFARARDLEEALRKTTKAQKSDLAISQARHNISVGKKDPSPAIFPNNQVMSLKTIQEQILDKDTVLIVAAPVKGQVILWSVGNDFHQSHQLVEGDRIEKLVQEYYRLLSQGLKKRDPIYSRQLARELSQRLLGPLYSKIKGKRLLVVCDGILQYLPFAALVVPGYESITWLVEEHEIVSLPSMTSLLSLRLRDRIAKDQFVGIAVVADPVFHKDDPRLQSSVEDENTAQLPNLNYPDFENSSSLKRSAGDLGITAFARLPNTSEEAKKILELIPEDKSLLATGLNATRETFIAWDTRTYNFLHIATHGFLNPRDHELSGLVLTLVDAKGQPVNGFLAGG